MAWGQNQVCFDPFLPGWKANIFHCHPPSQEGGHQRQGRPPAPGTLHGLVEEGVTNGSVIRHDSENLSSATYRSAIGDIGAHPEILCPNSPPGETEAGSLSVHRTVKGGSYPPHQHGSEYIDTGRRCPFLQTPQPHIACIGSISSICILTWSNWFVNHVWHCWSGDQDDEKCSRNMTHWNIELAGLDALLWDV